MRRDTEFVQQPKALFGLLALAVVVLLCAVLELVGVQGKWKWLIAMVYSAIYCLWALAYALRGVTVSPVKPLHYSHDRDWVYMGRLKMSKNLLK